MATIFTVSRDVNAKSANEFGIKATQFRVDRELQEVEIYLSDTRKAPTLGDILVLGAEILKNMGITIKDPIKDLKKYVPWHWVTWKYHPEEEN